MILLMGPIGAGKSVQGHTLADKCGYAYISTGELFRLLLTGNRRTEMLQGKLISDQDTIDMVDKVFDIIDTTGEFILDGFPRTAAQVDWLLEQVGKGRFEKPVVVHINLTEEEIYKRLSLRGRPDDTEETIKKRHQLYQNETRPLLSKMRNANIVIHEIDGIGTPEEVHELILKALNI